MKSENLNKRYYDLVQDTNDYWNTIKVNKDIIIDEEDGAIYIDVHSNKGPMYEGRLKSIHIDKNIICEIDEFGEDWDIEWFNIPNVIDKILILNLIENE